MRCIIKQNNPKEGFKEVEVYMPDGETKETERMHVMRKKI
jgi:hypothetical protein